MRQGDWKTTARSVPSFYLPISDDDPAIGDFVQPGEHGEDGGFSASGVPDETDEFAFFDVQIEIDDGFERFSEGVRVVFCQI